VAAFHDRFAGVFPAIATPLNEGFAIDEMALRRVVRHLIDGGVSGIWVLGSGGEFASLTDQQRRQVVQTVAREAAGNVTVVAGISDTCVSRLAEHLAAAQEAGADAVFVTTPFYYHLAPADVTRFYLHVAERAPLPVVLYNNPSNAKGRCDVAMVKALADHPRIAGLKDSSCDLAFFQDLIDAVGGRADFRVFQGHDPLMVSSALLGADGCVVASALVAPRLVSDLFAAARAGNLDAVRRLNRRCRLLDAVYTIDGPTDASFLAGQKAALEALGLCSRRVAPPFQSASPEQVQAVRQILARAEVEID
jgi:dihydrodipicolinate synthase/N-acetylneuraminate lyase